MQRLGKVRPSSGFGPVRVGHWILIELSLVVLIVGVALALAVSEHGVARFRATSAEVFMFLQKPRLEIFERISLTGGWEPAETIAPTQEFVRVDGRQSIDAAQKTLQDHGASLIEGDGRTRMLRLGTNYVALVRYADWPETGVVSFRPAVPDVEHPVTVALHCGDGDPPNKWVAPPLRVASNLPVSRQPSSCRTRRGSS